MFKHDDCKVCSTTDISFDLRTGKIKEWFPNNFILIILTDEKNIYISITRSFKSDVATEIILNGKAQPDIATSNLNVEDVS